MAAWSWAAWRPDDSTPGSQTGPNSATRREHKGTQQKAPVNLPSERNQIFAMKRQCTEAQSPAQPLMLSNAKIAHRRNRVTKQSNVFNPYAWCVLAPA
jgi:hypothetical protein